jgi:hypothetical protein
LISDLSTSYDSPKALVGNRRQCLQISDRLITQEALPNLTAVILKR